MGAQWRSNRGRARPRHPCRIRWPSWPDDERIHQLRDRACPRVKDALALRGTAERLFGGVEALVGHKLVAPGLGELSFQLADELYARIGRPARFLTDVSAAVSDGGGFAASAG